MPGGAASRLIEVVAPASPVAPEVLAAGLEVARALGLAVEVAPSARCAPVSRRWLAGEDSDRAEALIGALGRGGDVWMARGGYGSGRLLTAAPGLQAAWRGTLWAFSDGTALLARAFSWGKAAWSAPPVSQLPRLDAESRARLVAALGRGECAPLDGLVAAHEVCGAAEGPLMVANLAVLASLCGTALMPSLEGAVLVIEDVNEPPFRLDRFFWQLERAGALERLAALVVGELSGVSEADVGEVLGGVEALRRVPVWTGLGVGHGERNACLPVGRRARVAGGCFEVAGA